VDRIGNRAGFPSPVAIALGSNLGDRRAHLEWAFARLAEQLTGFRASSIHETEPAGVPGPQPRFLNAAVVGETSRNAQDLLRWLLDLERERGRTRDVPLAPRTLDMDLILYGDAVIAAPGLTVPHPRFRARRFVLEPLAEIAPDLRDPVTGHTVAELLSAVPGPARE
jgi:2-amino-4-hydroxy-6-hydroxymethyldihydropteridine diphosphokinase